MPLLAERNGMLKVLGKRSEERRASEVWEELQSEFLEMERRASEVEAHLDDLFLSFPFSVKPS